VRRTQVDAVDFDFPFAPGPAAPAGASLGLALADTATDPFERDAITAGAACEGASRGALLRVPRL